MLRSSRVEKTLVALVVAFVVVLLVFVGSGKLFRTYRNSSEAMEPTLPTGTTLFVTPVTDAKRGELVTFRYPRSTDISFVKRVVAVGGDTVEIRSKQLFINGRPMSEPYVIHEDAQVYVRNPAFPEPYRSRDQFGPFRVEPNHFFVLGDNRDHSYDSRYWGTVPRENLRGRVRLVFSWRRGFWRP